MSDDTPTTSPRHARPSALLNSAGQPLVWFITGGSSGLGAATAEAALEAGYRVAATSRDTNSLKGLVDEYGDQVLPVEMDLRQPDTITTAVATAELAFGQLDILFNNAGIAVFGAVEEVSDELLREQLEVNLLGPLAVLRAVLPGMRARRAGRLLQMSSLGGRVAFPGLGAYHASKWGFEGASVALAQEVSPLGIKVTIVEPGDFRTPVLAPDRMPTAAPIEDYAPTSGAVRQAVASLDGNQPGDPRKLAAALLEVVASEDPPLHLVLGPDAYERIESRNAEQMAEMRAWAHLSKSTNLDEVRA